MQRTEEDVGVLPHHSMPYSLETGSLAKPGAGLGPTSPSHPVFAPYSVEVTGSIIFPELGLILAHCSSLGTVSLLKHSHCHQLLYRLQLPMEIHLPPSAHCWN